MPADRYTGNPEDLIINRIVTAGTFITPGTTGRTALVWRLQHI